MTRRDGAPHHARAWGERGGISTAAGLFSRRNGEQCNHSTSFSAAQAIGESAGFPLPRDPYARAYQAPTPPPLDAVRDGYPAGPDRLVLLGPPGTGKTRASLEAFGLPALRATGDPSAVLMCSFTRAAAGEIQGRLATELGGCPDDYRATARTIHSEALRLVLAASGGGLRFTKARQVIEAPTEELLPEERLAAPDPGDELRAAALRLWDLARNRLETGDLRRSFAAIQPVDFDLAELEAEIAAYEREKTERQEVDFTDLLLRALEVPAPRRALLLVDEAQDSSPLQWALFERWGAAADTFVLVGDLDQAVHRWCGAHPERLIELARQFEVRRLQQSYRVPRRQHSMAVDLIRRNRTRIDAPYEAAPRDGSVLVATEEQVVKEVEAASRVGTPTLVLARSRALLRRWSAALEEAGVAHDNERGPSLLGSAARVRAARAVLRLRAGQAMPAADLHALLDLLPAKGFFPSRMKRAILDAIRLTPPEGMTAETLRRVYGADLTGLEATTLEGAFLQLRLHTDAAARVRLATALARLVEVRGAEVLDRDPVVSLTTAHAAKGREAPLVVVDLEAPGLVLRSLDEPAQVEAERQLLYVALTRSSERLLLVRHERRDLGEELGLTLRGAA